MAAEPNEASTAFDMLTRLDDEFNFLLQFVEGDAFTNLSNEEKHTVKAWVTKLSTAVTDPLDGGTRLTRNLFLVELTKRIQGNRLDRPFNQPPRQGPLGDAKQLGSFLLTNTLSADDYYPVWLDAMKNHEANKVHVGGKHFETYLSTRLFEDGRGACAYLAVSCQNEGQQNSWVQFRRTDKDEAIERVYRKEMGAEADSFCDNGKKAPVVTKEEHDISDPGLMARLRAKAKRFKKTVNVDDIEFRSLNEADLALYKQGLVYSHNLKQNQ